MAKRTWVTVVIFLVVGVIMITYLSTVNYKARAILGGKTFDIDVADTAFTMTKGLSGRESIGESEGMLFIFEEAGKHGFWMKNMNFSIDMIWLDKDLRINHIEKNVSPSTYPTVFTPEKDSYYVLEVKAGQTDILGVKEGDILTYYK